MQTVGERFTDSSAFAGNVLPLPDFPAEIRAPAGTWLVSGLAFNLEAEKFLLPEMHLMH